jgi:hypothetical protein
MYHGFLYFNSPHEEKENPTNLKPHKLCSLLLLLVLYVCYLLH